MKGFYLIDKEKGQTSFDVVRDIRKLTGEKRVGHAGTLDPLATGLLIVAVCEATKLLEYLIGCDKEYEVTAFFGAISNTYDAEGKIVARDFEAGCDFLDVPGNVCEDGSSCDAVNSHNTESVSIVTPAFIESFIKKFFIGEILQTPPQYSALKVNGKKACDVARAGGSVDLKARKVSIYSFEILKFDWPKVSFKVKCGSGTYIRSLIHDLGQKIGCGAYVLELRRTKVFDFDVKDASLKNFISIEEVARRFNCLELSDEEFEGLKDGRTVPMSKKVEQAGPLMAFYKGKLVGVLRIVSDGMKYEKVIF